MTLFRTPTLFLFSNEKIYLRSHIAESAIIALTSQQRRFVSEKLSAILRLPCMLHLRFSLYL